MPHVSPPPGLIALNAGTFERSKGAWRDLAEVVGPYVGIGGWLTPSSLVFAHVEDRNRIKTIDLETGEVKTVLNSGPNVLCGAGGVWSSHGQAGYQDSHRRGEWDWVPFCVDDVTGLIGLVTDNTQREFAIWDGMTLLPLLSAPGGFDACFRDGLLVICNQGNWYHWTMAAGLALVGRLPAVGDGARHSHGWYLGWYGARAAQVIWPHWDPTRGILVTEGVVNFNAQIYRESPSAMEIQVIGSRGQGEIPGEQQVFTVDLAAGTVNGKPWETINLLAPPTVVVLPTRRPVFTKTARAIGVGIFDEPAGPAFADPAAPAPTDKAVFCTVGADDLSDVAALASARRLPVSAYLDASTYPVERVPQLPGLSVRPLVQCYPRAGESRQTCRARIFGTVTGLRAAGFEVDLCVAAYCQYRGGDPASLDSFALTEQQVLDNLEDVWTIAVGDTGIGAVWCFVWDRVKHPGVDGLARWPNIMAAVMAMRAASADWRAFPAVPVVEPPVVVTPEPPAAPPAPVVVPPVVASRPLSSKELGPVLAAVVPAIGGFIAWLLGRRKKKGPSS
jgi:hypothetical protein